jgi:hypothetical protein
MRWPNMVASAKSTKERIVSLLDALPEDVLPEVVSFLEYQQFKLARSPVQQPTTPRNKPTPMGGLERGTRITADDIAEARREMWGRFADDDA